VKVQLSFRTTLMTIVAITALAFGLLIFASGVVARRVEVQLFSIQNQYLPKVVLRPELEGSFDRLRRGFQDAVAAHDAEMLEATKASRQRFLEQLTAARASVDPEDESALRDALGDYYASALDVSRRLIADETGEALVDAMASMQAKQTRLQIVLEKTTAFDGQKLQDAFALAARSEAEAQTYRLWISVACLAIVLTIWLGLSRSLLRSVAELIAGFGRFGAGHFEEPIPVVGATELAGLATQANRMAANLDRAISERRRVEAALQSSNHELEAFSYSVAHDLRAPLRAINGFSRTVLEDYGDKLDAEGRDYLQRIGAAAERLGLLIDALLALSRVSRVELQRERVDMTRVADAVMKQLRATQPDRVVEFVAQEGVTADGDPTLLRALFDNLLGNAWKFTGARTGGRIAFGTTKQNGSMAYYIKDNGAGFDMAYSDKLFAPFQRLHQARDFAGTGIGLATVQRIVRRHGGEIWAEAAVGAGATFYFTLASTGKGTPS
jgi:signal transduction histidine kinase